ncbi:tRNAHis guanylyltransferase, putative [Plasmodium berghei]|uniref:tRNA(His) guanylyltransferase n=2 Tax=Plasmodium berghei TaxID=5821 RepID=A0A509AJC3_PLABA|nr:tRNAHis guanylyltransferase, putative [Plasmodium berghei ANKA]CXI20299.1 tRNAHis guanylyltransferase, putative [Plasmodium berghei]SCM19936.1 tRNAHis guanylyltransferase, putative [Plasmodium berghei]SCN23642.1 tRNAHis guanylyltransferase, putative [Plasmodium berghei]SCO59191.1 tRNAHis guanylyltransferase, putative [Plasmodium berghei]SCO60003.1 tRNAHis guanylyltransferase, putative [Plasmodium berghei]|eukprot:XP_034420705.1 tRNAHis guanylyltransferase, putative [Plasmodium berghei ANKA]
MANSKFAYVKLFEEEKKILLNCYFVVRIDGSDFKKFIKQHEYIKPNDLRGLNLMNECAINVLKNYDEIDLCYGHSDEFSFLFRKSTKLWNRRHDKILTNVVSYFTSSFTFNWKKYFPNKELIYLPSFDARIIVYPTESEIKDYFSWRQADCHINTQYNECFWNLVLKSNYTHEEAYKFLLATQTKDKNELLFTRFDINYNNIPEIFRRGTIIIRNKNYKKNTTQHIQNNDKHIDYMQGEQTKEEWKKQINPHIYKENTDTDLCDISNVETNNNSNNSNSNNFDPNILKPFQNDQSNTLDKFIITHENLISETFWNKYDFVFKKKKELKCIKYPHS